MTDSNFKVKDGLVVGGNIISSGAVNGYLKISNYNSDINMNTNFNGYLVFTNNGYAHTITLTDDSQTPIGTNITAFSVDQYITFTVYPTNTVTLANANDSVSSVQTNGPYCIASAVKIASNTWLISGDLS
jgi:hypothetical protein